MKVIIRHCYISISWITIVSIVILAVLLSIGRILSPAVQDYLPEIREQASKALGQPVNIASIDIRWHGIAPSIHLGDVEVLSDEDGKPVLSVEHIYIRPDFYRLITEQKPVPSLIALSGSDLTLEMLEDQRLIIPGIRLMEQPPDSDTRALMASLRGITFSLLDARVQWINRVEAIDVLFSPVNASMAVDEGLVLLEGDIGLPDTLGKRLRLNARVEGDYWVKDGWSVKLHGDVQGLKLEGVPQTSLFRSAGLLEKGNGDVAFWLDWERGSLTDFRGRFDFKDLTWDSALSKGHASESYVLDHAKGVFHWQMSGQGWTADLNHLSIRIGDHQWPESSLSFRMDQNERYRRVVLRADYLHLGEIASIALSRAELGGRDRKWLQRLRPDGALRDTSLDILFQDGKPYLYSASAAFEDLGWASHEKIPGLSGLNGDFSFNEETGDLRLSSDDAWFDYPALFREALQVQNLAADVDWTRDDTGRYRVHGNDIKIATPDIHGEGVLGLGLGAGPGEMELKVGFFEGDGHQVIKYLPAGILKAPIYNWLVHALKGGYVPEGQLLFKGRFKDFPFKNDEGIFITRFTAEDTVLDYWKGWPRLEKLAGEIEFRNTGLNIDVSGGRVFDSNIKRGTVRIKDLGMARLKIDAEADGPLSDVFAYLSKSPLGKGKEALLDDLRAQGNSHLTLGIDLPVSKKLKSGVAVKGLLDFQSCKLEFQKQRLKFTDLNGQLNFTEKSVHVGQATARLGDSPLDIKARTLKGGDIRVDIDGHLKPAVLMQDLDPMLHRQLGGSSDWSARLRIPGLKKSGSGKIHLALSSDLEGVNSNLPAPLDKKASEKWPIEIGMYLAVDEYQQISLDLKQRIAAEIELTQGRPADLNRAHVHFGKGKARLPEKGIELSGNVRHLDFSAWEKLFAEAGRGRQARGPSLVDKLSRVNLNMEKLDILDRRLTKFRVNALKQQGDWKALVASPWISGTIYRPVDPTSRKPLRMELDYLNLSHPDLESRSRVSLQPIDLPALSFSSQRLNFADYEFNNVNLSMGKRKNGLHIHALSFDAEGFSGRLNGDWLSKKAGGRQTTDLTYNLHITDLGEASKFMQWDTGLHKGEGRIYGTADWQGGPTEFSYANALQGKVNLELKKGVITGVESGAGKILGLFNLDSLGKRIRMDFSDVQEKGFSYDRWDAQLSVNGPVITGNDMKIRGSAADLMFSGQGNVERRDMDVYLDVVPHIYSGVVPIVGTVIAGPAAGAALYLLGKIPGFSEKVNQGSDLSYRLTGAWDDPVVERLDQDPGQVDDDYDETLF